MSLLSPLPLDATSTLAWLATYLVHSTLLLSGAWLATRVLRAPRLRELVWRTALVGGLVTASLQSAIGDGPLALSTADLARWTQDSAAEEASEPGGLFGLLGLDVGAASGAQGKSASSAGEGSADAASGGAITPLNEPRPHLASGAGGSEPQFAWPTWIVALWLAWATFALARFGLRRRALVLSLADRRNVSSGPLRDRFRKLKRARGPRRAVRLTASARVGSPLALGLSEICVPEYAASELGAESHAALLAHELAHLRRRDAAWSTLAAALASLFPFQPLLRVAMRRMRAEAELLCDADAVRATGDGAALARCLVEVAERTSPQHRGLAPAWTAAMAAPRSEFVARVEAALEGGAKPPSRGLATATLASGAVALVALACAGPGVKGAASESETDVGDDMLEEPPEQDGEDRAARERLEEKINTYLAERGERSEPAGLGYVQATPETSGEEGDALRGLGYIEVPLLPEPDVVLELDDEGAIRADGVLVLPADASDFAPVRELLKAAAEKMPRLEWEGTSMTLANGILRIRATSKTPFAQVQSIMQQCGTKAVLIWRLQFDVERPDGSRSITPYSLPKDVGVHAAILETEEDAQPPKRYSIELRGDAVSLRVPNGVDWSGTQARLEELGAKTRAIVADVPDARFVIDAKAGTVFSQVDAVVQALIGAGATDLSFVGRFE